MPPKVSVIFATARQDPSLEILSVSMKGQSYRDFEVIVLDELHRKHEFVDVVPPPKKEWAFWNLSASLNAGIKVALGGIIVLLQDFIYVPPDGLKKFVDRHSEEGDCLVTGVGHQYQEPHEFNGTYPSPMPSGELWFKDPRLERPGFYLTQPVIWESNWSSFTRKIWHDIGGFDEEFDKGWGYDNVNFAERAQLAGYNVFIDTYNEAKCYSHIKIFKEKEHRDRSPNNQNLWHRKYRQLARHEVHWKLSYA